MDPLTQTQPDREAIPTPPITTIAMLNPSILLMNADRNLNLLLSRNTLIERDTIHLRGVRQIKIPLGWRLALIRCVSRFFRVRLPGEHEFLDVDIQTWQIPAPAVVEGTVIGHVDDPSRLIPLTHADYFLLLQMNGRSLHRWLVEHFGLESSAVAFLHRTRRRAA